MSSVGTWAELYLLSKLVPHAGNTRLLPSGPFGCGLPQVSGGIGLSCCDMPTYSSKLQRLASPKYRTLCAFASPATYLLEAHLQHFTSVSLGIVCPFITENAFSAGLLLFFFFLVFYFLGLFSFGDLANSCKILSVVVQLSTGTYARSHPSEAPHFQNPSSVNEGTWCNCAKRFNSGPATWVSKHWVIEQILFYPPRQLSRNKAK